MKGSCVLWNNVYNRWITSNFRFRWHRTTSTTSGWKFPIFNRNSSGERRLKFVASGEDDDKKPLAQRPQTFTEAATKYYNYTANGADEKREHRLPTLQKAMRRSGNAYSLQQNYLWCNDKRQQQLHDLYNLRQEYLSNGLRTAYQSLHHEQNWLLQ